MFKMSQSVLHLAFPISSRQSDDSSPQSPEPSDEDLLNYQEKGQIFCLDQERRQSLFLYKDQNDIFSVQSVLFQIALTSSSGQPRKKVNILTKNPFQKRPMSCSDMPIPSFENMALIHFIYPKNFDEISLYLSALGAIPSEKSPGLLILCGLEDYLSKNFIERIQQLC